jgi:acyl-CoA thioester hydrolase
MEEAQMSKPVVSRSEYRVIYGDTDQMGIVYYANYLRFFERGRTELLNQIGYSYKQLESSGVFVAVIDAEVRYKQPAKFNDLITIESWVTQTSRVRLRFDYRITREEESESILLAEGATTHACMNAEGRPVRPPQDVLDALGVEAPKRRGPPATD